MEMHSSGEAEATPWPRKGSLTYPELVALALHTDVLNFASAPQAASDFLITNAMLGEGCGRRSPLSTRGRNAAG